MKSRKFKIGQKVINTYSKGTWTNGIILDIDNRKYDNLKIETKINGVPRIVWQVSDLVKLA